VASRKEEKERLRQERLERERQASQTGDRKRLVGLAAAAVLVLAAIGAIAVTVLAGGDDEKGGDKGGGGEVYPGGEEAPPVQETDFDAAVKAAGCTFEEAPAEGRDHVEETVQYATNPPHSGNHSPEPADDGVYDEAPATGQWVHSLEHGRLPIQFKASIAPKIRGQLKAFVDADPFHMMLFPNSTDMPYEVAISSWTRDPEPNGTGHLLGCPKAGDKTFDAIAAFRTRFRDNDIPPENVP